MGCAVNQCYSTEAVTLTSTMIYTTTEFGEERTYRSTAVTVETPTEPTTPITVNAGSNGDQAILKYFPTAIAKASPSSSPDNDDSGGLSTGTLAGIIAGSVAFLIIVLVAAYIIIRHLNKVVAAVSSKESDNSQQRPPMRQYKLADSEGDNVSANPLMMQRPSHPAPPSVATSPFSPAASSNGPTPAGAEEYQIVANGTGNSRQTSFETTSPRDDYFTANAQRLSQVSRFTQSSRNRSSTDSHGVYTHVRHPSVTSDSSEGGTPAELDATAWTSEHPNSPSSVVHPREERRGSYPSRPHQRGRSESLGQSALSMVSEEMHGFHGPRDHLVGQTDTHRPGTGKALGEQQQ